MTAQEQGLKILVSAARQIVPPALDFVIIIYRPEGPMNITSVLYPSDTQTPTQQYERAKKAAHAFITNKPHPSFNAEKN